MDRRSNGRRALGRVLLAAGLMMAPLPAAAEESDLAQVNQGYAAYTQGDFATARALWEPLANRGDGWAQYYMGLIYEAGQGVPQDDRAALAWYLKAANSRQRFVEGSKLIGHPDAKFRAGLFHYLGRGTEPDLYKAFNLWSSAGGRGHAEALYNLGVLSETTEERKLQSDRLAWQYYHLAAEQGHPDALAQRDRVAGKLSERQIADARRFAAKERERMGIPPQGGGALITDPWI